jgi:hypothetical protein
MSCGLIFGTDFCFARDCYGQLRREHKPEPAVNDGQPASSCAWCGCWLTTEWRQLL